MNTQHTFLMLLLFMSSDLLAQSSSIAWAGSWGGPGSEQGSSIAFDSEGSSYTVGTFSGTVDFDPGAASAELSSLGFTDGFISKLDSTGNLIWATRLGGSEIDAIKAIAVDDSDNIYVTGTFSGSVDFDPSSDVFEMDAGTYPEVFVAKFSTAGDFIWAKQFVGTISVDVADLDLDSAGNVHLTGSFWGTVDFDPDSGTQELSAVGTDNVFISKLDNDGQFIFAKQFQGSSTSSIKGLAIEVDEVGNIYTAGIFFATVDFDPGPEVENLSSNGEFDIFISKLSPSGEFLWVDRIGSVSDDFCSALSVDPMGNVVATGYFSDAVDFDPGTGVSDLISIGGYDVFMLKLDTEGVFMWAKSIGGSGDDFSFEVRTDNDQDVFISGRFSETLDMDPGPEEQLLTAMGNYDGYLAEYDSEGELRWVTSFGGLEAGAASMAIDDQYTLYATGSFSGEADYFLANDTISLQANGATDAFALRLEEKARCNSYTSIEVESCTEYTVPSGDLILDTSGVYTDTLSNLAGCDSILLIDLTIYSLDPTIDQSDGDLMAIQAAESYQWLDCDNGLASIPGENGQSFTPTMTGSYAVELNDLGCSDTSACLFIVVLGVGESELDQVRIFPNPSSGHIVIDPYGSEVVAVKIFDTTGRLVYEAEIMDSESHWIDFNEEPGSYFIEMRTKGTVSGFHLIRE